MHFTEETCFGKYESQVEDKTFTFLVEKKFAQIAELDNFDYVCCKINLDILFINYANFQQSNL